MKITLKFKNYIRKNISKEYCKLLDNRIENYLNCPKINVKTPNDLNTTLANDNILKTLCNDGVVNIQYISDDYAIMNDVVTVLYRLIITVTNYGKFKHKNGGYVANYYHNWHFIKLYIIPGIISFLFQL